MRLKAILLAMCGLCCSVLIGCAKSEAPPPSQVEVQEFFAAVQEGDASIVDRLLKAKPNLANAKNSAGETPLQVARKQNNDELEEVLKKHGAKE
jgi:hypothetical protein